MASDNETLEEKQPQLPAQEVKGGEEHEEVKEEEDEGVGNEEKEEKGSGNEEEEEKGSGNEEEEEKGSGNDEEEKGSDNVEVKDEKERMDVDNKSEQKEKLEGEKKGSTRKRKERKREREKASPVTPAIDRPTRERKIVERYTETSAARSTTPKPFSIEKGRGTALKDIPNVAFMLSKRKPDDSMQTLHHILFGRKTKALMLKRNIGMFSGFAWAESEEEKQRGKLKEKLDKCVKEKLFYFCDVLNIPIHRGITRKEELSAKLLEFLKSPHATTDTLLADKEKKGKKQKEKASASKTAGSSNTASGKSAKKQKNSSVGEKRKRSSKSGDEEVEDTTEPSDSKENSLGDDNSDIDGKAKSDEEQSNSDEDREEEHEEPNKQKPSEISPSRKSSKKESGDYDKSKALKKDGPVKSSKSSGKDTKRPSSSTPKKVASGADSMKSKSSKKQKVDKKSDKVGDASAKGKALSRSSDKISKKDPGKGKSAKKAIEEPSKEEMEKEVVKILKRVDFNTATLSDILRQLGEHFGVDLMHRKAEVKAIITEAINNMTDEDEDDDDEEDEEAEPGGDDEKDDDDDAAAA